MLIFTLSCASNSSFTGNSDSDVNLTEFNAPDMSAWDTDVDVSTKDSSDIFVRDTSADKSDTADIAGKDTTPEDIGQDSTYTGIYSGLADVTGNALKTKLHAIVTTGYHSISYSDASYKLKNYVDNYNGYVTGVYTGHTVPVSQANSAFNVEHTWPQSKGASGTAKSDIHHLYPTNNVANSARGNLTFGYVVDVDKDFGDTNCTDHFTGHPGGCLSYLGYDSSHTKVFEPRDVHKGNAARAVLYFAIRYNKSLSVFDSRHPKVTEKVLKEWNHLDPPDAHERTRNDRIQTIQNNRNPFIDHPEFVDQIEFVQ